MPNFNNATLLGHLGRDPELRYTPQGTPICSFSIAVNNRTKVGDEWKDVPMWVEVNVWGKQAEPCSQYLVKGRPVLVNGSINVENWVDRDNKARFNLVLNAAQVTFMGDKPQDGAGQGDRPSASKPPIQNPEPEISDEDIPF